MVGAVLSENPLSNLFPFSKKDIRINQTEQSPLSKKGGVNLFGGSEQFSPTYNYQQSSQETSSYIYSPTTTRTDARSISLIFNSPNAQVSTKKDLNTTTSPRLDLGQNPILEGGTQSGAKQEAGIDFNKILLYGALGLAGYLLVKGFFKKKGESKK